MKILAIESSCDETSAAVVEDGRKVHSNIIASSVDLHKATGGVVPEVAAREHMRQISPVVDKALEEASSTWDDIDAIAVTTAPGLIAALLIGVNTAQTLAYIHNKPLISTHHIAGHIYSNFLDRDDEIEFPILVLTVSGGHNELVLLKGHHDFEVIGETLDDAAGEAFDKVARLMGMGYPGGPAISKAAESGELGHFDLPLVMLDQENRYNFSFSGLKSAVLREVNQKGEMNQQDINNLSASFQEVVTEVLSEKLKRAAEEFDVKAVHLAGGVSANGVLREKCAKKLSHLPFMAPVKMSYCTDNAAMIGAAAYFLQQKDQSVLKDGKQVEVNSQRPL